MLPAGAGQAASVALGWAAPARDRGPAADGGGSRVSGRARRVAPPRAPIAERLPPPSALDLPPIWRDFDHAPGPEAVSSGKRRRIRARALAAVQARDRVQLGVAQLEVEDLEVLLDSGGGDRLRDHHVAELDVPAKHDLGAGPLVSGGDLLNRRILQQLAALRQRAPGLGGDPVLRVES